MKILVLGASGMAGHTIALYFKEQGHEVYAFSRKQFLFCTWIGGDAFDIDFLKNIVTTGNYDAIINCIGLLYQFADSAPDAPEVEGGAASPEDGWPSLAELEQRYIRRVLEKTGNKLMGPGSATELLGVHYTTLRAHMLKMGLPLPRRK